MIISDEQAHLAAEYLHSKRAPSERASATSAGISPDLVQRVRDEIESAPETRGERVAEARAHLSEGPSDDEVAAKMLGRIISDSLR